MKEVVFYIMIKRTNKKVNNKDRIVMMKIWIEQYIKNKNLRQQLRHQLIMNWYKNRLKLLMIHKIDSNIQDNLIWILKIANNLLITTPKKFTT